VPEMHLQSRLAAVSRPASGARPSCRDSCCVFSSSSEVVRVHLPAEFAPLPAPVRAHDEGVPPVRGAAAVRRRPAGQGGRTTHTHTHTHMLTHVHIYNLYKLTPNSASSHTHSHPPTQTPGNLFFGENI